MLAVLVIVLIIVSEKMFKMLPTMNFFKRGKKIKKITVGICAMAKKAESKPMKEMLSRLPEELFEIKIFGNKWSSRHSVIFYNCCYALRGLENLIN